MNLFTTIRETIISAFPALGDAEFDFQPTPDNKPGDIGVACFGFGKILRTSPDKTALQITGLSFPSPIGEIVQAGPYVNFTLDRTVFATALVGEIIEKGRLFGSDGRGAGENILLEHTSINPNASPHIGRARNGLIGDTFARLLRYQGYHVNVHYYVNDMGKQIGLLVLQTAGNEHLTFDEILGQYVTANERVKNEPDFEKKAIDLLMKREEGETIVVQEFKKLVDICLKGQLEILGRLGFSYDTFDYESSFLHDPRMDEVIRVLKEKGVLFVDDEGRTVVDLAGLGWKREEGRYIVLLRANGSSMYMYRDIAYTLEKIERAEDGNFIVLGEDHKMYFEQLAAIIRFVGKTPPEPIHYSYILLREGKMSTRDGNVVLLKDFLDEVIRRARERVDEQWPDIPEGERGEIAQLIGIGAVRYTILSVRPNRNVIFDWDTALSFTGDSGPYIQYSCTRISSILRKYGSKLPSPGTTVAVTHDAEWNLIRRMMFVENDIRAALETRNPAILATSALDIARRFSVFYTECPVLTADDRVKVSRIALCMVTRQVVKNLLGLLGIETPERM